MHGGKLTYQNSRSSSSSSLETVKSSPGPGPATDIPTLLKSASGPAAQPAAAKKKSFFGGIKGLVGAMNESSTAH